MAELAEFPVIGWIAQRFRASPQSTVETPPLIAPPPEPTVQIKPPAVPPAPFTVQEPRLPREERGAQKKAEYLKWKAVEKRAEPEKSSQHVAKPAATTTPLKLEAKPANLPSGIKERIRFPQGILMTEADMPWLNGDRVQVGLELMTLATTKGEQFLYGSLIHGKKLRRLFGQFTPGELRSADNLLFVQLSELIQYGFAPDIEKVHNHISSGTIFETGNDNGGRVYFMRFGKIQGLPVIIRIAAVKDHKIKGAFSVICKERL